MQWFFGISHNGRRIEKTKNGPYKIVPLCKPVWEFFQVWSGKNFWHNQESRHASKYFERLLQYFSSIDASKRWQIRESYFRPTAYALWSEYITWDCIIDFANILKFKRRNKSPIYLQLIHLLSIQSAAG